MCARLKVRQPCVRAEVFSIDAHHFQFESRLKNELRISGVSPNSRLFFNSYDFDRDGIITSEDVRFVLSYIPLKTLATSQGNEDREGLYDSLDNRNLEFDERMNN